jgi:uncharacterized protein YecE (DUF72 family)
VLAQFPASFKAAPESRDYLSALLGALGHYPVAVELRHKSWSDDQGGTSTCSTATARRSSRLTSRSSAVDSAELPAEREDLLLHAPARTERRQLVASRAKSEDRYNYLYSADELREFSDVAGAADALVKKSYAYTNNHFASKSVVNAVMLKAQLGQPIHGEVSGCAGRALS